MGPIPSLDRAPMPHEVATKRQRGRPVSVHKATPFERMVDALIVRACDLNDLAQARTVLRTAGFPAIQIEAITDIAVAAARARTGRR